MDRDHIVHREGVQTGHSRWSWIATKMCRRTPCIQPQCSTVGPNPRVPAYVPQHARSSVEVRQFNHLPQLPELGEEGL